MTCLSKTEKWMVKMLNNQHFCIARSDYFLPKTKRQMKGLEWTNTHHCTNVDGWCTNRVTFFLVPPCPWPNQGDKLMLMFCFFTHPPHPPRFHLPTYLHLDYRYTTYLCTQVSSLPHLPTHPLICLPTHQPTYLCTYALNLHQGNDDIGWWGYCNIPCRLFHHLIYLPNYRKQCCNDPTKDIAIKLDLFIVAL